jgi:hypothetical protein
MIKVRLIRVEWIPVYKGDELTDVIDELISDEVQEFTFSELARLVRDYPHRSASHPDANTWIFSQDEDYRTGSTFEESAHFDPSNPTRKQKYWIKAIR